MPQKTNLNISPYYDDFNIDKNFYKVLFKPGFPVQARELTTLQSILQNQVESFGSHIFKEGSMVIPGSITYDDTYYSVKITDQHLGIDVSLYLEELVGKKVSGQTSGITATVNGYDIPPNENVENITLYVKYSDAGSDFERLKFQNGEILVIQENITYGNTTINSGETIATLVDRDATAVGFAVGVSEGIYFIRGSFVKVSDSLIVLEPYSNTPSYRVGLTIIEEIITSNDDDSLVDNARGFSNYTAPGADRFKISTVLSKKSLDDFDDKNFIELLRVDEGQIKKLQDKSTYSIIKDYFAKRTYEESGDYALQNFEIDVLNSLNDRISNGGVYLPSQKTEQGNTPSDNLMCVRVSPGTAYVRGYDIKIPSSINIDVEKPRDTKKVENSLVPFELGNLIKINNVQGTPFVGINTSGNIVELYNERRDNSVTNAGTGTNIGKARVYSFSLSDAPYNNKASEWDLYLYDIQTYTKLTLNQSLSSVECPATSFIKGLSSGASGFVNAAAGGSSTITLVQTSGTFIVGEQISINGSILVSRTIKSLVAYNLDDIKSVYQDSTSISSSSLKTDFIADTVLYPTIPNQFTPTTGAVIDGPGGVVNSPGNTFLGIRSDAIISYQFNDPSFRDPTYTKVDYITSDGFTMGISAVDNVVGVCTGALGASAEFDIFRVMVPKILNEDNPALYVSLNNKNISSVNLSSSDLVLSTQIREQTTNSSGQMTVNINTTGISSAFFESYDAERYSVFYSDGTIEDLTGDQVALTENGTKVVFSGLKISQSNNVTVNVTLRKRNVTSRTKNYIRSEKLVVNKTISGINTSINGLTQNNYYGLRIEDDEISLNVPDVSEVIAVYESLTTGQPQLDQLTFPSGLSLDTSTVVGEKIIGNRSGSIAQLISRTSSTVEFVYLNSKKFESGEEVTFEESLVNTVITSIIKGSYLDITKRYTLSKGQKEQFYDYSRLTRTGASAVPSRQLLAIFNYYDIPSNDIGDLITVNSYDEERYLKDIPLVGGGNIRCTDTLDFRPRVSRFTSTVSSPFDFNTRSFVSSPSYSIISPNESSIIGYDFYLPRVDKIVLNKLGQFSIIKGTSAVNPKEPLNVEEAMDIATISLPAYLYNPTDAFIKLVDNRRYTMRDIGKLEDRIKNLEVVTSLSMLEVDTKSLQIQDADGLSRFKSGFFVDDFKNTSFISFTNPDVKCDVDVTKQELISPVDFWSLKAELALAPSINLDTADLSTNLPLLDSNVQKTGDLVTLSYSETIWLQQPLASDKINVNPYQVIDFTGGITLNPSSDSWVRNIYINSTTTEFNPIISIRMRRVRSGNRFQVLEGPPGNREGSTRGTSRTGLRWANPFNPAERVIGAPVVSVQNVNRNWSIVNFGGREYDYVSDVKVVSEPDLYSRSRNVEFRANGLLPLAQHYHFIDDVSSLDIIPKLLEIEMISGSFEIGEEIVGFNGDDSISVINFRCAQPNHKSGSYNSPAKVYTINPYNREQVIPSSYSATSSILNVDTFSLSEESLTKYNGYVEIGTELIGSTSGAVARVTNIRLISDNYGDIIGCFFIRDPNQDPLPLVRIKTGERTFKIALNASNLQPVPGEDSRAQTTYSTNGIIQTQFTSTVQVRNPPPPPPLPPLPRPRRDPLAQSFTVDGTGAFITSCDVYFATKDTSQKLFVELRTVELGTPTNNLVQDYAFVELDPDDIQISDDASIPTKVTFPSPVYLQPNTEYALVFLAPGSKLFSMWAGVMKNKTVNTQDLPDAESVVVTRQYLGGSLFKSQNGTIWTADQEADLTFKLYKAQFNANGGDVTFFNPTLRAEGNTIPYLIENGIRTLPRKVTAGITTTYVMNSILVAGKKVTDGTATYGYVERVGGPISGNSGSITGVATGIGYSGGTFSSVSLYNITGSGTGAKANITFGSFGNITSVSIASTGNGYSIGDILGITTSEVTKGSNATLSISAIEGIDTLYLTNVQGETFTSSNTLRYYDNNTIINCGVSTVFRGNSIPSTGLYVGNILEVSQINHGMQSDNNIVRLVNIAPDTEPVQITQPVNINDTNISVADTTKFATFEGITTSRGYVLINSEIIEYTSIGSGTLGIARSENASFVRPYNSGTICYKYELNGVSLTRINAQHDLSSNSQLRSLRDTDKYYLEINRGTRNTGATQLNFQTEKYSGGSFVEASQNYQFSSIIPQFNIITPGQGTTVSAQLRTVSGTSAGGSESAFIDQGYQPIELNKVNFLSTPRLICSQINESVRLTSLPRNKSLTMKIRLSSTDPNLSPVLDLQQGTFILGRNKINSPISDYASDGRVNLVTGDPHSSIYISRRVDLKEPATSLKVYVAAEKPAEADFRVLYQILKSDSSEIEQSFNLFPGYDNLQNVGIKYNIINPSRNSGRPDKFVRPSRENEFLDYEFSMDNLDPFTGFAIKIVMSSTNESKPVKFKDLRVVALA